MAKTWEEMVEKGKKNLRLRLPKMKVNYDDAKPSMKTNYGALPFGPLTKASYNAGVDAAVYRIPDVEKWGREWRRGAGK